MGSGRGWRGSRSGGGGGGTDEGGGGSVARRSHDPPARVTTGHGAAEQHGGRCSAPGRRCSMVASAPMSSSLRAVRARAARRSPVVASRAWAMPSARESPRASSKRQEDSLRGKAVPIAPPGTWHRKSRKRESGDGLAAEAAQNAGGKVLSGAVSELADKVLFAVISRTSGQSSACTIAKCPPSPVDAHRKSWSTETAAACVWSSCARRRRSDFG